jgi:hypothetical protein
MPTYSGNLVGVVGTDGTVATGVAANYRRAIAPFTNFGTRQIAFFVVTFPSNTVNTNTTEAYVNENTQGQEYAISDSGAHIVVPNAQLFAPNSAIYAALNGIAIAAEIALVGAVTFAGSAGSTQTATFTVGAFVDTAASANADMQHAVAANGAAQTIQAAVRAATGVGSVTVQPGYLAGNSITVPGYEY